MAQDVEIVQLLRARAGGVDQFYGSADEALDRAAIIEIERLQKIEEAARRFVQEAQDFPRYAPVKVWATPEVDPYLKLRVALGSKDAAE